MRGEAALRSSPHRHGLRHRLARALALALSLAAPALAGACSSPGVKAPAGVAGGAIPLATARRLPPGTFYALVGPAPISYNLWSFDRSGRSSRLTDNRPGFGVSMFDASASGIVLADAASGVDELTVLTARGPVLEPDGHASAPVIDDSGLVAYVKPPLRTPYFVIGERTLPAGATRIAYEQRTPLSTMSWGPGGALLLESNPHLPGVGSGPVVLLVLGPDGRAKTVATPAGFDGVALWGEHASAIAVLVGNRTDLVTPGGHLLVALPAGWRPVAWSPSGTQLLVLEHPVRNGGYATLGLWQMANPASVMVIGPVSTTVAQMAWLAAPAPLASG